MLRFKFKFYNFGGNEVQGRFEPAQKNVYTTLIGDNLIDLRKAELPRDAAIRITICSLVGDAKVIVPPNTRVDVGGVMLLGDKKISVDNGTEPSGAHVEIRYNCIFGDLEVTSKD